MRLKVCGMKYQDNIEQVAALQPDYLGFIFHEKSIRNFSETSIPPIPPSIKKTGVFVDAELQEVMTKINLYQLQAVQLHGAESPEYCEDLKQFCHFTNKTNMKQIPAYAGITEIIKAFSIDKDFDFDSLKPYESVCDYFLFDTKGKLPGGNGIMFDWTILKNYRLHKPFFLSGGIGLNEVESLLAFLRRQESKYCFAIDVNSKFELEAGLKNIELLKEFKHNVITKEERLK